jgi:hypothetical protein
MPERSHPARRGARLAAALILTAVAVLALGASAQAQPANDNFAAAEVLSGASGSTTGTDVDATFEVNEVSALAGFTSGDVWYKWTAPSSGFIAFRTSIPAGGNPLADTVLAAHTGNDITALTTVVQDDDYPLSACPPCMSRIIFNATAGTVYAIAIGAFPSDPPSVKQGPFGLAWGGAAVGYCDVDDPMVTVGKPARFKHVFSLSFVVSDVTAAIVGSSWITDIQCRLDGGPFEACTSPWSESGLNGGLHTWTIRVTDGAGNDTITNGTVRVKGSPHKTS